MDNAKKFILDRVAEGGQRGCRECMNAAVRRYQGRKKRRAEAA